MSIPEEFNDIMQSTSMAHLATVKPDGTPQNTLVWFDYDGTHIIINSARGRAKDRNMTANPAVAVSILDPTNGYRYVEVQGRVVEITEDGADGVIDALARKYLGVDEYPYRQAGEVRVTYKIAPIKVLTFGGAAGD